LAISKKIIGVVVLVVVGAIVLYAIYTNAPRISESPLIPSQIRSIIGSAPNTIKVSSAWFKPGGKIPLTCAYPRCGGSNLSAPLSWSNVPRNAKSLVVIVYDPDAPTGLFIHWILYNIPPTIDSLPEGVPHKPIVAGIGLQAQNDFGEVGYGGPCPPPHSKHRYVFMVLALDSKLNIKPGAPAREVLVALKGHVIAYGYTYGVFGVP